MNLIPIVYEDAEILIINKKAGLASQGGVGITNSVDTILRQQYAQNVFLLHRLDKDTAGLLIVAKTSQAAQKWAAIIQNKQIIKKYYAICINPFKKQSDHVYTIISHKQKAQEAHTSYKVQKTFTLHNDNQTYTINLVDLQLHTGRMHQLRIHLAQNSTPIIGDDKYGDFKINKLLSKHWGIKKLHLVSYFLQLPNHTQPITIDLPDNMQQTLQQVSAQPY